MCSNYVNNHKKIKNGIDKRIKNRPIGCVNVNKFAKDLKMDVRTVKKHLEIMRIDNYGTFIDDKRHHFCTFEGLDKIRKKRNK